MISAFRAIRSRNPVFEPGFLALALLGLGSAFRGFTLDRPWSLGGSWSWKAAEVAGFVLGESKPVRWFAFGGAFLASMLLGSVLCRWPGFLRPIATFLVGADLALCGVVGDWANVGCHGVALALIWWRRAPRTAFVASPDGPVSQVGGNS